MNRSPVVAERSRPRSARFGGVTITEDRTSLPASDEAPGSRASYSSGSDSGGEPDYSLTFDNESMPGFTVVGIDGMDQDNLLMDVILSFYEMGIRYLSETQLVLEVMAVFCLLYRGPCSLLLFCVSASFLEMTEISCLSFRTELKSPISLSTAHL